jgi:ParB-like chromosome segregation protein Spo0J
LLSRSNFNDKICSEITLSQSCDIPFNRLPLKQSNVRRIKAGVSIEGLAQDIARRTLLQSLTVRPVFALARTAPIPSVVRTEGLAEEDSLAENVQRAPLHPLDQFRAFLSLRPADREGAWRTGCHSRPRD